MKWEAVYCYLIRTPTERLAAVVALINPATEAADVIALDDVKAHAVITVLDATVPSRLAGI